MLAKSIMMNDFCIRIEGDEGELHCPFCTVIPDTEKTRINDFAVIYDTEKTFVNGCAVMLDVVSVSYITVK